MAKYTAYDVAKQLNQIRNYHALPASALVELPRDVLSAFLWVTAEWRQVNEMKELLQMGANPHEEHDGFTVLEMFLQGHDGTWRCKSPLNIADTEAGVKLLFEYGVTRADLKHEWILSNCGEIITESAYLCDFFGIEDEPDPVDDVQKTLEGERRRCDTFEQEVYRVNGRLVEEMAKVSVLEKELALMKTTIEQLQRL
jgi:hypothetical protein